jgi:hypothetical protein
MVIDSSKHTCKTPVPQASRELASQPNKINANTPYDFEGKNLTAYGGLLPVTAGRSRLRGHSHGHLRYLCRLRWCNWDQTIASCAVDELLHSMPGTIRESGTG